RGPGLHAVHDVAARSPDVIPSLAEAAERGPFTYGNSTTACPCNRRIRTMAPRHCPLEKSKPTTSSRATQYRSPFGAKRKPRGSRNSALPFEENTRTSCPSVVSYSLTLVTASAAPNGCSLETTTFPFGAIARSSGHYPGSTTHPQACIAAHGLKDIR